MAHRAGLFLLIVSALAGVGGTVLAALGVIPSEDRVLVFAWLVLGQALIAGVAALAWLRAERMTALAARRSMAQARAEAVRQANRLRADMLATTAHEVRTPLGGILGLLDLVLAVPTLPRGARADAAGARQAAADLMLLLRDLIEVPGSAAPPLAAIAFRIDDLMEQVVALLRARAAAQGNRLAVAVAAGTPPAWRGDPPRIRQILTNMVANAIRFTEAGEVRIEARETSTGALELSVSDTGRGIPPERLGSLFDRFQVSDGGTGLGLSICRDLAARMGGSITVASAPRRGTSFSVMLPLPQVAESEVPLAEPPPPAAAIGPVRAAPVRGGPPVLVVDDVPVNRRLLATVLERAGYTHEAAGDGETALAMARDRPYAAVLMDLQMPEMDGLEATRRLRALPGAAGRLPVIAVTAHAEEESRRAALAAGMDGYLVKPVGLADLVAVLGQAIDAQKADP